MRKQSFIYGAWILLASALITKVIGALFKIPLTNLLGGSGMGYFSCAYGIFLPIYAVSITGLPTSVAKLTAEYSAKENYSAVKRIKKLSMLVFSVIGLILSILLLVFSRFLAENVVNTPLSAVAIAAIAPSVFIGCVMSVCRGCCEGMCNMYPTAVSQVIEAVVKLFSGILLAGYVMTLTPTELLKLTESLHINVYLGITAENAVEYLLPVSAAAGILGVTLGAAAGMLYLLITSAFVKKLPEQKNSPDGVSDKKLLKALMCIMIPAALGSLVTNLTSVIDLCTINRGIEHAFAENPRCFIYNGTAEETANFYYGCFSGLSLTVFNLIPSFTNMFGKGILPSITSNWTKKDMTAVKKSVSEVLFITGQIAIPSGIAITVLSKEILDFLFSGKAEETAVSAASLSAMGAGVIFLAFTAPVFAMLQSVGKAAVPVKIMAVGVALKLLGNLIAVPIPSLNIVGAGISTSVCYGVICILSLAALFRTVGVKAKILRPAASQAFAGTLCACAAKVCAVTLSGVLFGRLLLPVCIVCGMIVYFFSLYLMNIGFFSIKK